VSAELSILVTTAFSVGFLHTLLGPDHYVPFVAMSRSNQWSSRKTFLITALCGMGHVIGSVVIGSVGLILGSMLMQLETLEAFRGDAAAWLLIGFGLAYLTWGTIRAVRDIPHVHMHSHLDGTVHTHLHKHDLEHRHVHQATDFEANKDQPNRSMTPWLLFLIFVFGPCEVLIPLLMYPAAEANVWAIVAVVLAFSVATIGTMLACVMTLAFGLSFVQWPSLHRYSHALAGLAVLMCGVLVKFGL
jgi:ABC-type nickel/cobalt efflux system permease component RcnA